MPRSGPPTGDPNRPEDSPLAWFGELLLSHDRGDYPRASEAQRQLARLGWHVNRGRPRREAGRRAVPR
jgi:hypothetical protein